jgi:hypothetical protein
MPIENEPPASLPAGVGDASLQALLASADASHPFGPSFFLTHLHGLVRDHCPSPGELPRVDLHLQDGEVLHVCHIVGLAPTWLAIAVAETAHPAAMRLEMIPYGTIVRVTVSTTASSAKGMGFDADHAPAIVTEPASSAEGLLASVSQPARGEGAGLEL